MCAYAAVSVYNVYVRAFDVRAYAVLTEQLTHRIVKYELIHECVCARLHE